MAPTLRDRRWIILGFLVAAAIINYADRQVIAVLKPDIQREMGWTDGDYGTLASIFQFAAATGLVFAGWLVDRLGIRSANPVGVAAWSLAAMGHALARTLLQFSLVRVALGATEAIGTPMAMKTVSALFDADERSNAIGLSNASTNIGAIVTPLLLAPFIEGILSTICPADSAPVLYAPLAPTRFCACSALLQDYEHAR